MCMSFLQKLEAYGVQETAVVDVQELKTPPAQMLAVDVFRTDAVVVIYAQVPGALPEDVQVTVSEEGSVVLLEGRRQRPEDEIGETLSGGAFVIEECAWEYFYRRIVLPEPVDQQATEAVITRGVLLVTLPLQVPASGSDSTPASDDILTDEAEEIITS